MSRTLPGKEPERICMRHGNATAQLVNIIGRDRTQQQRPVNLELIPKAEQGGQCECLDDIEQAEKAIRELAEALGEGRVIDVSGLKDDSDEGRTDAE